MKKIVLSMLILVLCLSLFLGVTTVYAENDYSHYHQIKAGIKFRSATDMDNSVQSFELPEGYWVELVEINGGSVKVRYNGAILFVDKQDFTDNMKVTYNYDTLTNIYYRQGQPIHAVLNDDGSRAIFKTPSCQQADKLTDIVDASANLVFLNSMRNDNGDLVYVIATPSGQIGYLRASGTDTPNISVIPDWEAPISNDVTNGEDGEVIPDTGSNGTIIKPNEDDTKLPAKNNIVKIVLIVAICILAAVLVFLIFKPTRNKKSGRYTVDNDDDYDRDDSYSDRY